MWHPHPVPMPHQQTGTPGPPSPTTDTASSRPRAPQLMIRASTPSRQTLGAERVSWHSPGWGEGCTPRQAGPEDGGGRVRGDSGDGCCRCLSPPPPQGPSDSPYQDPLGAADEADQHQEADGHVEQQQAQVAQPPAGTRHAWAGHSASPRVGAGGAGQSWANSPGPRGASTGILGTEIGL